jgi:hypothetical protein
MKQTIKSAGFETNKLDITHTPAPSFQLLMAVALWLFFEKIILIVIKSFKEECKPTKRHVLIITRKVMLMYKGFLVLLLMW